MGMNKTTTFRHQIHGDFTQTARPTKTLHTAGDFLHFLETRPPAKAFEAIIDLTRENFHGLIPKVRRAKKFVRVQEAKSRSGGSDALYIMADCAPANIALSLYSSLRLMFKAIRRNNDKDAAYKDDIYNGYLLSRIQAASSILSKRIDDNMLMEGSYPADDEELASGMMKDKLSSAMTLHRDICRVLDEAPSKLGVNIPPPPQ